MRTCLLLVALLAAGCTESHASDDRAPDPLPLNANDRATAICQNLVASGVAKNCSQPSHRPGSLIGDWTIVTFDVVGGFPNDQGMVTVYFSEKASHGNDALYADVQADDYPNVRVTSKPGASWQSDVSVGTPDFKPDKWDDCREKKAVAACAKAYPIQYAAFRALNDAARRVSGR